MNKSLSIEINVNYSSKCNKLQILTKATELMVLNFRVFKWDIVTFSLELQWIMIITL